MQKGICCWRSTILFSHAFYTEICNTKSNVSSCFFKCGYFFRSTPSVFVFCLFLWCSSYKNEIDDMEKFCFCKNCISLWACKEESTASLPLNGQIKSFIQWKFHRKLVPVDSFKDLSLWLIRKFFRSHFSNFVRLFDCAAFSLNNFQVFFREFLVLHFVRMEKSSSQ